MTLCIRHVAIWPAAFFGMLAVLWCEYMYSSCMHVCKLHPSKILTYFVFQQTDLTRTPLSRVVTAQGYKQPLEDTWPTKGGICRLPHHLRKLRLRVMLQPWLILDCFTVQFLWIMYVQSQRGC